MNDQYNAVRWAVGLLDLSGRGKIEVTGPDRETFLHAMISNEVNQLPVFSGRYGTFLTSTGKMVSDLFYYKFPDFILIDIQRDLLSRTIETLEKFIIMDEVYLKDRSQDFDHISIQGPDSRRLIEELFGEGMTTGQYQIHELAWTGAKLWLIGKPELAGAGFEIVSPIESRDSLRRAVLNRGRQFGMLEITPETFDVLRLEAGIPRFGVDMDENNYPMEARLNHAISLTKGCYIGQEVVSKATHIGGVARLLSRLRISGEKVPKEGWEVFDPEGKKIGRVTSAAFSPQFGCPIAFAYLKRAFAQAGQSCTIRSGSGDTLAAEVE
ncbi:MAG: YgfZ/GcvT domain-containing protein [Acidobacteriota bacterium]